MASEDGIREHPPTHTPTHTGFPCPQRTWIIRVERTMPQQAGVCWFRQRALSPIHPLYCVLARPCIPARSKYLLTARFMSGTVVSEATSALVGKTNGSCSPAAYHPAEGFRLSFYDLKQKKKIAATATHSPRMTMTLPDCISQARFSKAPSALAASSHCSVPSHIPEPDRRLCLCGASPTRDPHSEP